MRSWKKRNADRGENGKQVWHQVALLRLSGDLAKANNEGEICKSVVNVLHDTLGFDFLALFLLNEDTGYRDLAASVGFENPATPLKPGEGVSEKVFHTKKLQYTKDVSTRSEYFYGMGGSEVDVPIWVDNEVKGVIIAESRELDAFHEDDFQVLMASAHITGLAIEKWRVIEADNHRRKVLEALSATMTKVTGELELEPLLSVIVERAAGLLGATGGELGLLKDGGDEIEIVVSYKLEKDFRGTVQKIGSGLMGKVIQERRGIMLEDYSKWDEKLTGYANIHATLGVPLVVGKRVLGAFTTVHSGDQGKFNKGDLEILEMFGQQAALAIENARLYKEARNELEERTRLQAETLEQKEYYQALFLNNPVAVVTADLEGYIISWNPMAEKLFGYSEQEVVGQELDSIVANRAELREEASAYTNQVLQIGTVQTTTRRTRRDGSLVEVELLALPITVEDETTGFIAIYHDITGLKQIERELVGKNEKILRELELAGEIQTSFMPRGPFDIQGWEIATMLKPARETSGDFFDIQILPNNRLGILVADVVDKGVGAALFMAMCWSLLRTYGYEYSDDPRRVLIETNTRIMNDTKSSQFLTAFLGSLDTTTGELKYSNAGHLPPILIKRERASPAERLMRTGIPVGITDDYECEENRIVIGHGDILALYTDGVTEAFASDGNQYEEQRLTKLLQQNQEKSASELIKLVLNDLAAFTEESEQTDDIAIIMMKRKTGDEQG